MENAVKFDAVSFGKRVRSMMKVDFRRMFKSRLFYILIVSALIMPILMTVMMSMMDGKVSVNPQTGVETVMEGPENTWQNIGTLPDREEMGGNGVFMMCNINMVFMLVSIFICLFISDDFRSGYAKNLFTIRAKKGDYIISKTLAGFVCGALMLIAYFTGSMLGGAISCLSFDLHGLSVENIAVCMISKVFLIPVFISIFVLISVAAKQKAWLALCGSIGGGMLLFMMVSVVTPLGSTFINVILCLAGGILFAVSLGAFSKMILNKTSLV